VEWHLREKWKELLYADEELDQSRRTRDPVRPPEPSASARRKKLTHQNSNGVRVQTFSSLIANLATLCRNTCHLSADAYQTPVRIDTDMTALQRRAFELLDL